MTEEEKIKHPMSILIGSVRKQLKAERVVECEERLQIFIKEIFILEQKVKAMKNALERVADKDVDDIYWGGELEDFIRGEYK